MSTGSLLVGVGFAAQALCLARWRHGIRLRVVVLPLVMIAAAWSVDAARLHPDGYAVSGLARPLFVAMLTPLSAVLRAGVRGETVAEIAAALHLSAGAVRNHVSSVLGKLGLASRQQATIHARARGWI